MSNLTNMSIAEALKGLEDKDFTSVELTQAHIEAIVAAKAFKRLYHGNA